MTDFLIVGRGLAATVLMHTFYNKGISFCAVGNTSLSACSTVAAGIWNPVVFKRMSKSWMADKLIPKLIDFYSDCENSAGKKLLHFRNIVKPFMEDQEIVLWQKCAKDRLADFLDTTVKIEIDKDLAHCKIPGPYGVVNQAGYLNVAGFLDATTARFKELVLDEVFEHNLLSVYTDHITYKSLTVRNVIFCEGFLVNNNPFFNWIPLKPAKGEVFELASDELLLYNSIFNYNGFIVRADNKFKVGATYAWDELGGEPTEKGRKELHSKLNRMIKCDYKILQHKAGIRPASIDRRPVIGPHPAYNNVFVFNGLGAKGVMLAPYFAENFVNFYQQKAELNAEVDIKRFYDSYKR